MNIDVTDLDLGYTQCEELNSLVTSAGEPIISNLASVINNLKVHWIGSDATMHINNLIKVYDALVALLTDAKIISADAGNKIIAIQEIRNSNGGGGSIGSGLSNATPTAATISQAEPTNEYFVDPSANNDYALLQQICTDYKTFKDNFRNAQEALMSNWTAGANREQAVSNFNEFEANTETYTKYLTEARDNLGIAVSNISQL